MTSASRSWQIRGRALRLDPADPEKLASNWDVVCVAPDLARGTADYGRFVRRHSHLHAPCEDGSIETGVSHVHPLLSPYLPPGDDELEQLNVDGVTRATDRTGARERWRIGEPYVGEDVPVLLVRRTCAATDGRRGGTTIATGLISELPMSTPRPRGPVAAFRVRALERAYPTILPLDRVARAIVEAYVALGDIGERAAASLTLTPRAGGIVRCSMPGGDAQENEKLAAALDEAINPALNPRYVVSRPSWPEGRRPRTVLWRALTFRDPLEVSWHPVPSDLGSHKERATTYYVAWQLHIGPGQLLFAGR